MKRTLLLDIVIGERTSILQLLARKNEALLVGGYALFVLNLGFHVVDGVRGLHLQRDGLASQRLHKYLHAATETKHEVQSRFLLDIIIRECATILQLFACEDKALLIRWNSLFVLYLCLYVIDCVRRLHLQGDRLSREGLDEDLHTSAKTKHKMECRLLLNIVVGQCATILQLLSGKDKTLLVRGNTLLVLDLRLDIVYSIRRLDLERDRLSSQRLDKNLHASTKAQDEMKGALFLDVVIRKSPSILKLLSSEDETLLIRRDSLLILDLGFDVINSIGGLHLKGDGLSSEGLYEDLHFLLLTGF